MKAATALVESDRASLYTRLASAVAPRRTMTVTAWADTHRVLSSKGSGEPGRYNSGRTPHLREIMDDLSAHSPVQRVTVMKPAQGGVTELALNWIGYVMDEAPAPMLAVVPTLEVRQRWVRQRLEPMINECPQLARIFDAQRQRDAANSESIKDFPGGMLILGGANSPASLSSMPIRYAICDELDRFPWEVGKEGDPLGLIDERTKAFMRRKVVLISTPTIAGESRIEQEYLASDQRELQLPCPHCDTFIVLRWRRPDGELSLDESATTGKVYYICPSCGSAIEEHYKTQMLARHRWVARYPDRRLHHGYHWNGLCAPIGLGFTWREMLDQYREAEKDTAKLKRWTNTSLGEAYEEKGDGLEDVSLASRCEVFPDTLPTPHLVVAGADVQKDRIEFSVYAYLETDECWALDHQVLPGDTADAQVWDDLDDALADAGVQLAGIDAGYNTQMVNAFVAKRSWCIALKGVSGMNRPIVEDERKRRHRLRQRRRRGVPHEPVGVDTAKATIYARLRKQIAGPGFIHYPLEHPAFDSEFFAQLAAEKLVTRIVRGRPSQEWIKTRPRNEALDCAVYALATVQLAGVAMPRAKPSEAVPIPDAPKTPATPSATTMPRPATRGPAPGYGRGGEFSL